MNEKCPVCQTQLDSKPRIIGTTDDAEYSCPRCGRFRIDDALLNDLPSLLSNHKDSIPRISFALRRSQESNQFAELRDSTFQKMLEVPLPRPREQADLFIRWIAKASNSLGVAVKYNSLEAQAVIGAKTPEGLKVILQHLEKKELLHTTNISRIATDPLDKAAQLTFDGWEHFEQIQAGTVVYRKAFMAMKYGDSILNSIVQGTFKPSTIRAGFELKPQNETHHAGLIDNLMRVEIQSADFLIADLTHQNLGAYWEAGYAEGLGKPVIYTCEKSVFDDKKTHFDTNHHLTIVWDEKAPEVAGEELTATIRATLPHLAKMTD